jgi:hypothetical protein
MLITGQGDKICKPYLHRELPMTTLLLNSVQQRRLKKLAREAGRTPEQTLRFVLRDGFDFCEWEVRESIAAEAEADAMPNGTIPNDQVQRRATALIESAHARRRKQAA